MDYEKIEVARFSTMEDKQPVGSTLGNMVGEIKGGTLRELTAEYRKLLALDPESDVASFRLNVVSGQTEVKWRGEADWNAVGDR